MGSSRHEPFAEPTYEQVTYVKIIPLKLIHRSLKGWPSALLIIIAKHSSTRKSERLNSNGSQRCNITGIQEKN
jgi:hypothetical protein